MPVSAGREFLSIPGPTVIPDAVLAAMQRPAVDIYSGPLVALTDGLLADMSRNLPHGGAHLHLRGERPRRLGGRAHQRALARRQGAGAGKRPLRDRLGRSREDARRRGGDFAGRLPPRRAARGGRGAAEGGPRASRRSWWRRSTPRRACTTTSRRSARRRARRAATRCCWSTPSPRSAACRSRWMPGASTSRWRARRRA